MYNVSLGCFGISNLDHRSELRDGNLGKHKEGGVLAGGMDDADVGV